MGIGINERLDKSGFPCSECQRKDAEIERLKEAVQCNDMRNIGEAFMEEVKTHEPEAVWDYCPTELYVSAVRQRHDLEDELEQQKEMSWLASDEQITRPANFLREHPDKDMLQTVATCQDGTEVTIVFLRGRQEHVQPLIREKAKVARLEKALKRVVDECDLPREEYTSVEWDAIQKAKQAIAGGEE
jgi:hypothetical protein